MEVAPQNSIRIGCAGWSLRKEYTDLFPSTGTHLQRYAERFTCVEVNSSFYRPHRRSTYARWAASTPDRFQFSVKLPKQITHINRLINSEANLLKFVDEVTGLGRKLGPVLVQLPPSLYFEARITSEFFGTLRSMADTPVVCEPRHSTWFTDEAEEILSEHRIGRVAADPSVVPAAAIPGGCNQHVYFRWHGSPRIYYSTYGLDALETMTAYIVEFVRSAQSVWCIFDNTAEGAATKNAFALTELVQSRSTHRAGLPRGGSDIT